MPIELIEANLPWTGGAVKQLIRIRERLACHLPSRIADYLPSKIEFYADKTVNDGLIERFLDTACEFLVKEMAIREARVWRLLRGGLSSDEAIREILFGNTHNQRWAIYYSERGGLPDGPTDPRRFDYGTVPCSTMRNHGVSWRRRNEVLDVWLVTAPKSGLDWEMDSDIGHESAHAAFAPVPLFVQSAANTDVPPSLIDVNSADDLEPDQVARLLYFCSELAVIGVRGESRRTYTRLPIADPEELFNFLRLADEIFPDSGFERAQRTCRRVRGNFDLEQSDAVFDVMSPVLRILPQLNRFTEAIVPPSVAILRSLVCRPPKVVDRYPQPLPALTRAPANT